MLPGEAPTPIPPPGGVAYFENHGKPEASESTAEPKAVYIDIIGERHTAVIIAARKDKSFDIQVEGQRRDAVREKQDEGQTGDYLIFPEPPASIPPAGPGDTENLPDHPAPPEAGASAPV